MAKLEVQFQKQGSSFQIKIVGDIDEESRLSTYSLIGAEKVEMDLEGLGRINSLGVKAWIDWIDQAKDAKFIFSNCPEIFVHQANIMSGFLPKVFKIQSFFIPYYWEEQELERSFLFDYDRHYSQTNFVFPEKITESDGRVFCIGVNLKRYLNFLQVSQIKK